MQVEVEVVEAQFDVAGTLGADLFELDSDGSAALDELEGKKLCSSGRQRANEGAEGAPFCALEATKARLVEGGGAGGRIRHVG